MSTKGYITTHVIDLAHGKPALNMQANLYRRVENKWQFLGKDFSNEDGRMTKFLQNDSLQNGNYKMVFESGAYYKHHNLDTFYPEISIIFNITDSNQNYHIPLLLNQYGFSTYRGS
jgi:hydroxyisourate hydrolase